LLIALTIALLSDIPCGFSKTLTLDMEEVSDWVNSYLQGKELEENYEIIAKSIENEKERNSYIKESRNFNSRKKAFLKTLDPESTKPRLKEKIEERLSEESIREAYFVSKRSNNLIEGVTLNGKHFLMKKEKEDANSILGLVYKEKCSRNNKIKD